MKHVLRSYSETSKWRMEILSKILLNILEEVTYKKM